MKSQCIAAEGSEECPRSFAVPPLQDKEITVTLSPFVQGEKAFLTTLSL